MNDEKINETQKNWPKWAYRKDRNIYLIVKIQG